MFTYQQPMSDVELVGRDMSLAAADNPSRTTKTPGAHLVDRCSQLLDGSTPLRSLVIIPTYNECDNLVPLVTAVLAVDPSIDVLVVDDNSPDGTGALADALARDTGRVRVHHREGKQGLGTAYVAGFRYALAQNYARIVEMDADFSHRPEDLARLLQAADSAHVVVGSRNVPGGRAENWSVLRHLISKGGSLYARTLLHLPVKDCTSGFKCFRREVLAALDLDAVQSNGFGFQVEMNYLCQRAGLRLVEVPIVFPDRTAGRSKMSLRITLEAALLVWRLRRGAPSSHQAHAPGAAAPGRLSHRPHWLSREGTLPTDTVRHERLMDDIRPLSPITRRWASACHGDMALHARRFIRFSLVGGLGVGVNSALLYVLSDAGQLDHLLAAALATEATILCNFALNDCWTFHDAHSTVSWRRRAVRYNSIALGGLGISLAVLALLMRALGLYYLIANLVAIGAATLWNYVVNARFTWTTCAHGSHHW